VTARHVLRFDVDVPASADVREPYSPTGEPTPVPNPRLGRLRDALTGDSRCREVRVTSFLPLSRGSQKISVWVTPGDAASIEDARSAVAEAVGSVLPDARIAGA
jgi:hypothetical protein